MYYISELVTRSDVSTYNNRVKSVNKKLKEITEKTKIGFVEQSNIGYEDLNFGGLRLNESGDGALALKLIRYIRDQEEHVFVPPNGKNISSNSSVNTHHEPTNKLWGVSLKKCSETATVNKTGFKVMALNIFSLMPHLEELPVFIGDNKPHIIGTTETKIDSTIQNSDTETDDYVIERNDRDKHGGGVALYIHKSINYRLGEDLQNTIVIHIINSPYNFSIQNCPQNSDRVHLGFQSPKRCIIKQLKHTKLYSIGFLRTDIYNFSVLTKAFPDDLKIGKVAPVYKSGDKDDLNNYHFISVLPTVARVFGKILYIYDMI